MTAPTPPAEVRACAKLNLCLAVTGVREDGYHLLDMINTQIGLEDRLLFKESSVPGIHLTCTNPDIPVGEANLITQAGIAYLQEAGLKNRGVRVELQKRIPAGGGLGGGSMDAAVTLLELNRRYAALSEAHLHRLAVRIGADVPYGLVGGAARVRGIGDRLERLSDSDEPRESGQWVVLLMPGIHSDTCAAYRAWDVLSDEKESSIRSESTDRVAERVRTGAWTGLSSILFNDLQEPVFGEMPQLRNIHGEAVDCFERLVLMTGSGSNLFTLHETEAQARSLMRKWTAYREDVPAACCPILI